MTKAYGLTGGIGCGKTTLADLLKQRGWATIDTDQIAHRLLEPGQEVYKKVIDSFGQSILNKESSINRHALADLVFSNPSLRQKLNEITHPEIRRTWLTEIEQLQKSNSKTKIVVVIPLLFETQAEENFAATLCVGCSSAVQRERLQKRDWSAAQIEQRINSQWPLGEKMKRSDFVFWNNGTLASLENQLNALPFI